MSNQSQNSLRPFHAQTYKKADNLFGNTKSSQLQRTLSTFYFYRVGLQTSLCQETKVTQEYDRVRMPRAEVLPIPFLPLHALSSSIQPSTVVTGKRGTNLWVV